MSGRSKKELMAGVSCVSSKFIARNTVEYIRANGERVIRLHDTDIVTFSANGKSAMLTSGGWKTVTTKDRISNAGINATVYSDRGAWFVRRHGSAASWDDKSGRSVPFFDGMKIPLEGALPAPKKAEAIASRDAKLKADVAKFAKRVLTESVPLPAAGDCWLCCMRTADGKPVLSDTDKTHLHSHVTEGYLHGSLIVNAMRARGRRDEGIRYLLNNGNPDRSSRVMIARDLRNYLGRQFGLVTR